MVGVVVLVLASLFGWTGICAIFVGCRNEYRVRHTASPPQENGLMTEIEEWLKQQA